jgi:hypothetical protein
VACCGNHDHFAIIYDNPDEQLDFIVPFLRMGLERGEKAVFIYDDNAVETVIDAMARHGIDVTAATASGALSIITKKHAYLKNDDFDPDWMVDFLAQAVEDSKREGFAAVRASGEMTWALSPAGDAHDRLVEYECKLNAFFPDYDMSGICQYNRNRFRPETLMHVLHTHPKLVFRGEVCENPYYIPADVLLSHGEAAVEPLCRLLENMAENTRLRRELAAETEARRRSEQVAFAARMAGILAHDINSPLEAMTNLSCLMKHEDLPARTRKLLDAMGEELDRLCELSKKTLDMLATTAPARPDLRRMH